MLIVTTFSKRKLFYNIQHLFNAKKNRFSFRDVIKRKQQINKTLCLKVGNMQFYFWDVTQFDFLCRWGVLYTFSLYQKTENDLENQWLHFYRFYTKFPDFPFELVISNGYRKGMCVLKWIEFMCERACTCFVKLIAWENEGEICNRNFGNMLW